MPKKSNPAAPFWRQMRDAERSIISYALEQGGSITKGAELLGISVPYMSERCHELGIVAPAPARRGRPVAVSGDGGGLEADGEARTGNPERPAPPCTCSPAFVLVPGGVDDVVAEEGDEDEDEDEEGDEDEDEEEDGEDGEGEDSKDGEDDGGKAV